jgi:hypothetical protein
MPAWSTIAMYTAGTAVLGTALAYSGGAVSVCVKERRDDLHIHLALPALAGPVAAKMIPDRHFRHLPQDLHEWLPALSAAVRELEKLGDATLVEVTSDREQVRVRVSSGYLHVDVKEARGDEVHVSFPLRTALALLEEMEIKRPTI